jgi:quinoprotein glucose dehydrogenase
MHWTVASLAATLPRKEVRSMNALDMSKRQVLKDRRAVLAMRRFVPRCTVGVLALLCLGCLAAPRGDREPHGNWPAYGDDAGGGRYSPLSQIDRENVGRLRVAWTYRTGEADDRSPARQKSAFEATPIMVDRTLFLSTPFNRVIALDPETGAERWVYDPRVDRERTYALVTSRGVSTWLDPDRAAGEPCRRRIYVATIDARLIALDAARGAPCTDFGRDGQIDLTQGLRPNSYMRCCYQVTSPPAVIGSLIVVGSSIGDNIMTDLPRGVVRAYDARTGALRWTWDPIPTDGADTAAATWRSESWRLTGAANAWPPISIDAERGLVFVPTSSPSPDHYGGERLGANLYANAVVALRAKTGKLVWHFQVVHHDLWDYDVPAQPALLTLTRNGEAVPAVVVATKMGHLFVLDRRTGTPLFPIEERPVPRSTVPGEEASPTQPFPVRPAPLVPQRLTADDVWGATPADRESCRRRVAGFRSEGIFTPPSLEGTVAFPGFGGGMHWGSPSHDPVRGLVIVNTTRLAFMVRLIPRAEYQQMQQNARANGMLGEFALQLGTPYAMYREPLLSPSGAPCNPPPWGTLAAVDLATGAVRWEVPLGMFPQLAGIPGTAGWGSPNFGGAVTTAGGLVFIAAGVDPRLRAFDVETGRELWSAELPASAQATPMTYQLAPDRKQFVVIAAGGHATLRSKMGDHVVAFTLP